MLLHATALLNATVACSVPYAAFATASAAAAAVGAVGKWGYYALGAYGSLAMAIFMVKTMKRVIFQETRAYGEWGLIISDKSYT
jgi:bacteriorhodopsin